MGNNIEIIDNFMPQHTFNSMREELLGNQMLWSLSHDVAGQKYTDFPVCDQKYNYQFYHVFYDHHKPPSPVIHFLNPFFDVLDPVALFRTKMNINPCTEHGNIEHGLHSDVIPYELAEKMTTAVFYLNNNNGYTKFLDGTVVESKENRIVLFPATMKHTGATCTDQPYRAVINCNFILRRKDVNPNQLQEEDDADTWT